MTNERVLFVGETKRQTVDLDQIDQVRESGEWIVVEDSSRKNPHFRFGDVLDREVARRTIELARSRVGSGTAHKRTNTFEGVTGDRRDRMTTSLADVSPHSRLQHHVAEREKRPTSYWGSWKR